MGTRSTSSTPSTFLRVMCTGALGALLTFGGLWITSSSAEASSKSVQRQRQQARKQRRRARRLARRKARAHQTPELDPGLAGQAAVLIFGGLLLLERKRKPSK